MEDELKIYKYECPNGHSMVAYKYHDGIIPEIVRCKECNSVMTVTNKKAVHNTKVIAIWRKPTKFEYDLVSPAKRRYYDLGGLTLDHFNGSSGLFREIKVSEIPEFRDWALTGYKAGDKIKFGLHHPICVYECERINDSANGWSLDSK